MRSHVVWTTLSVIALASGTLVLAQVRPLPRTIGVDELHPGMTGYGLTVFRGTQPERFDVQVLDVLHNARPGMDMVLIRTTHPVLDQAGVVAGMSGSPIYIDGRLLGAYAYGWMFGREPIAGVTPIGNMLAELQRTRRAPPGFLPGSQVPIPTEAPAALRAPHRSAWDGVVDSMRIARTPADSSHGSFAPLSVPLSVAGMSNGAFRDLVESFEPLGIVPLQSGGAGRSSPAPAGTAASTAGTHYVNGGAIGIALISGDISAEATGTVTYVDGRHVLAFGHPMLGLGEVALPATQARVAWILSSVMRSFKMAEPLGDLGALFQDRPCAIVVDEQTRAPSVPIHVRLLGVDGVQRNEWNVRVAYHRALFPRLYASVIGTAIESTAGDSGDVAWVVETAVTTRDRGVLNFRDLGASGVGTQALAPGSLRSTDAIERLTDNAFGTVRIDRIDVTLRLRWTQELYYVRSSSLARSEVDPGGTVSLTVSLGQYGHTPETRTVPITIPRALAGREVEIEIAGGSETPGEQPEPERIEDLVRTLTQTFPDDALVVSVRMPGQGVMIRGRALYDLPGSALDVLRPAASTDTGEPFPNVRRTVIPVGRLVVGRDRVRVRVRDVRE